MHPPSPMLLRALARPLSTKLARRPTCIACSRNAQSLLHTSRRILAAPRPNESPMPASRSAEAPEKPKLRTPELQHRRHRDGELQPKPLNRPLGLSYPPQPGQNTGRDTRTLAEKRDDFASYEKHLQRRQQLVEDVFQKNYYKDIGNLGKEHRGKSIIAPSTPFRAELAMYFPNFEGLNLDSKGQLKDTSPVMLGRISVVSMLNTDWAERQTASFTSAVANPELAAYMRSAEAKEAKVQYMTINVEENALKAFMIRLFFYRLRKALPKEQWSTYFLNKRGVSDDIRDALGMWNSKVGYVYLVDARGRIRWAANGDARDDERQSLNYCLKRLVAESQAVQKVRITRQDAASA